MKHRPFVLLCLLAGCSTHPLIDLQDYFRPGRLGKTTVTPYGGVAIPQGPIVPVVNPGVPIVGVPGPGGGVIPPPLPLPGNQAPGFQLQPPIRGDIIPPPPPNPPNFPR